MFPLSIPFFKLWVSQPVTALLPTKPQFCEFKLQHQKHRAALEPGQHGLANRWNGTPFHRRGVAVLATTNTSHPSSCVSWRGRSYRLTFPSRGEAPALLSLSASYSDVVRLGLFDATPASFAYSFSKAVFQRVSLAWLNLPLPLLQTGTRVLTAAPILVCLQSLGVQSGHKYKGFRFTAIFLPPMQK